MTKHMQCAFCFNYVSHKYKEKREHQSTGWQINQKRTKHKWMKRILLLNNILYRKVLQTTSFPSSSACKKGCILHLHNNWIDSVIWFWALEYAALNPSHRATYIPHLSYLSPEHHAGTLRKHLHFHPATASQTAQTTCRTNRRDSKLQQETEHSNPTSREGHDFPCSIQ